MVDVLRANTILYCDCWDQMVAFYRDVFGFEAVFANDWFVEFSIGSGAFVSIADAERSSIEPGTGAGLTLSWQVADVDALRSALVAAGVVVGDVGRRFGSPVVDVVDPAGNRIEFWSEPPMPL